jgi:hypothetical protein
METHKLSDIQIKVRIVPKRLRWPESGTSVPWTTAHRCVDALQDLGRNVDRSCSEAEQDSELGVSGIARRRTELCEQALIQLANFRPFEIAERALSESIGSLERLNDRNPAQVQMLQKLKQALTDLREGIPATQQMVRERCKVRDGVYA